MKPTAGHMQAYGILLTLSLSERVHHHPMHSMLGKRVFPSRVYPNFFFFTFILFFLHLLDVCYRKGV